MESEMVAQPEVQAAPVGLEAELAAFAKEQGTTIPAPVAEVKEQTPVVPEAVAPAPETPQEPEVVVPDKFKAPDGKADLAKIEKSTVNAEAMILKYRAMEKELGQAANRVNALKKEAAQPIPQAQVQQAQPNMTPVDLGQVTPNHIMQDLIENGMSVDEAKKQATTYYKLAMIAQETAYRRAQQEMESRFAGINERVEADSRQKELEAIAHSDPWVFSEDGLKTLFEIRQQNPYLNHSDRPWSAAYDKYLAEKAKNQLRAGSVVSTPTPKTPAALVTPVGVPTRPEAAPQMDFTNRASYEGRLEKMPLDKQLAFLEKELSRRGLNIRK